MLLPAHPGHSLPCSAPCQKPPFIWESQTWSTPWLLHAHFCEKPGGREARRPVPVGKTRRPGTKKSTHIYLVLPYPATTRQERVGGLFEKPMVPGPECPAWARTRAPVCPRPRPPRLSPKTGARPPGLRFLPSAQIHPLNSV